MSLMSTFDATDWMQFAIQPTNSVNNGFDENKLTRDFFVFIATVYVLARDLDAIFIQNCDCEILTRVYYTAY